MSTPPDHTTEVRNRIAVAAGAALLGAGLDSGDVHAPGRIRGRSARHGRAFGLLDLGITGQQVQALEANAATAGGRRGGQPIIAAQERAFQEETVEFKVGSPRGHGIQVPARQGRGAALLLEGDGPRELRNCTRSLTAGRVATRKATRKDRPRSQASGTLTAPFSGIHGWSWENTTDQEITVTLTAAGLLQHVARVPHRAAREEQDVPVAGRRRRLRERGWHRSQRTRRFHAETAIGIEAAEIAEAARIRDDVRKHTTAVRRAAEGGVRGPSPAETKPPGHGTGFVVRGPRLTHRRPARSRPGAPRGASSGGCKSSRAYALRPESNVTAPPRCGVGSNRRRTTGPQKVNTIRPAGPGELAGSVAKPRPARAGSPLS